MKTMPQTTALVWLFPFSGKPKVRCPKCLAKATHSEHHDTVVVGMCKERRETIVALSETPDDVPDEATEHLCRGCMACGYTWSEHVAGPEDLARALKSDGDDNDED